MQRPAGYAVAWVVRSNEQYNKKHRLTNNENIIDTKKLITDTTYFPMYAICGR